MISFESPGVCEVGRLVSPTLLLCISMAKYFKYMPANEVSYHNKAASSPKVSKALSRGDADVSLQDMLGHHR